MVWTGWRSMRCHRPCCPKSHKRRMALDRMPCIPNGKYRRFSLAAIRLSVNGANCTDYALIKANQAQKAPESGIAVKT